MKLKPNLISRQDGFIVQVLFVVFYVWGRISVFYLFRKIWCWISNNKKKDDNEPPFVMTTAFPEIWAVGNLVLAVAMVYLIPLLEARWLLIVIVVYAAMRIMEMLVYQINVLLFDRLKPVFLDGWTDKIDQKNYHIKSSARTVILLIFNMLEYIVQFAVIFAAAECLAASPCMHIGIMESFRLFMNLSDVVMTEDTPEFLIRIVYAETIIGIFVNIICLARFVGILPGVRELGYQKEESD